MKLLRIGPCLDVWLKIIVKNEASIVLQCMFPLESRGRGTKSRSFLLKHNKVGGITCFTIAVGTVGCHRICFKHNNIPNVATIFQDCLLSLNDSSSSVLSSIGSDSSDIYDREINNTKWYEKYCILIALYLNNWKNEVHFVFILV